MPYNANLKSAIANNFIGYIDGGGGSGVIEIWTSGMVTLLAVFALESTCGTEAAGVVSFSNFPKVVTAMASGVPAEARIRSADSTYSYEGLTVGLSGADIIISSINITAGQNIQISATPTFAV